MKRIWSFAHLNQGLIRANHNKDHNAPEECCPKAMTSEQRGVHREMHVALKKANFDLQRLQFNTMASACMKILNALEQQMIAASPDTNIKETIITNGFSILLRLLSPITPHITQALWQELGYGENILSAAWPEADTNALEQDEVELIIQVNGKLRGRLHAAKDADPTTLEGLALAHPSVDKLLAGQPAKKIIVVPGRLINIVT